RRAGPPRTPRAADQLRRRSRLCARRPGPANSRPHVCPPWTRGCQALRSRARTRGAPGARHPDAARPRLGDRLRRRSRRGVVRDRRVGCTSPARGRRGVRPGCRRLVGVAAIHCLPGPLGIGVAARTNAGPARAPGTAAPAAFLQAPPHEPAWLGPLGYALFAALGWFVARRFGTSWRFASAAPLLVVAGALLGWLASPQVPPELVAGRLDGAMARHPAGWLAGLAVLRGVAHARSPSSEAALGSLVAVATPALAIPLLVGGFIPEPGRQAFLEQ